ncbi:MAG TPA: hypothetical protein H9783_02710 [Candidatus Limosilactobacillus faecipullorum]|nr:hypothetical protein [Candidatus Limosilactobacillus faecipullorum]
MEKLKQWWQKADWTVIITSLIMGIAVTGLAAKLAFVSRVMMVGILLLIVNSLLSIWLGKRSVNRSWGMLFWFPGAFLIGAYNFAPRYMWPFALVYLGISYLTWSMAKTD